MIRLRTLSLKGFLSHSQTELSFGDRSIVIVGNNASGKTSILRGIFYALFGVDVIVGKRNVSKLINRGRNSLEVELGFIHGGKEYLIRRQLSFRGKSYAELMCNGRKEAMGVTNVNRAIVEDLRLDMNIFRSTTYVPQGELVSFLEGEPKERREILNRLMGFDVIAEKSEIIRNFRREVELLLTHLEGSVEGINSVRERLERLTGERERTLRRIGELKRELESTGRLLEDNRKLLEDFERRERRFGELSEKLKIFEDRLRSLREEVESLERRRTELESLRRSVPRLKGEVKPLPDLKLIRELLLKVGEIRRSRLLVNERIDRLKKMKGELSDLRKRIGELEGERKRLEMSLKSRAEVLKKGREDIEKLERVYLSFEGLSVSLKSEKNEVERRRRRLSALRVDDLKSLIREREELNLKAQKLRDRVSELKATVEEQEERLEKLRSAAGSCPLCGSSLTEERRSHLVGETASRIEAAKSEMGQLIEELSRVEGRLKDLDERVERAKLDLAEADRLKREIEEHELRVKKIEDDIQKLGFDPDTFALKRDELSSLEREVSSLEGELLKVGSMLETLNESERKILRELEETPLEKLLREREELDRAEVEAMDRVRHLRDGAKLDVSTLREVEGKISELEEVERKLSRITGQLMELNSLTSSLERKRAEITSLEAQVSNLKEGIEELSYDREKHISLKRLFEKVELEEKSRREELLELSGKLKQIDLQIGEAEREMEELSRKGEELKRLKLVYDTVRLLEEGFHPHRGFASKLREILLPEIAHFCRSFFEEFNFDFGDLNITEDLTVEFGIPGQGKMTLDQLSGGQKVAFALSLRFAMARKFMSTLDLLMLDEPTIHLDTERKQELANLLMKLKGKIPQMIIVTHDPELEVAGDEVWKVTKENGVSRVSVETPSSL